MVKQLLDDSGTERWDIVCSRTAERHQLGIVYEKDLIQAHPPVSILEAHVVWMLAVQKLSLTAKGIPSRGPLGTPKGKSPRVVFMKEQRMKRHTFKSSLSLVLVCLGTVVFPSAMVCWILIWYISPDMSGDTASGVLTHLAAVWFLLLEPASGRSPRSR